MKETRERKQETTDGTGIQKQGDTRECSHEFHRYAGSARARKPEKRGSSWFPSASLRRNHSWSITAPDCCDDLKTLKRLNIKKRQVSWDFLAENTRCREGNGSFQGPKILSSFSIVSNVSWIFQFTSSKRVRGAIWYLKLIILPSWWDGLQRSRTLETIRHRKKFNGKRDFNTEAKTKNYLHHRSLKCTYIYRFIYRFFFRSKRDLNRDGFK